MTELRQKMIESLQLRGLSERTQNSYVRAVRQVADHFHKPPDLISEEEIRQYFLFLKNVKHCSRGTIALALHGIKFFYRQILTREIPILDFIRPPREKKLSVVLSPEEVRSILRLVRLPVYRNCLIAIYSCGLRYHPHVHYITTGGDLSSDGSWLRSRCDIFVHVKPFLILFRAKFRDLLKQTDLFPLVDPSVWGKDWVVHCQGVGSGQAAFKYLAPYIFRVAIGNRRIVKLDNGLVTFTYKESATDQVKFSTIPAEEFIRRFLQHVLPDRFVKVRYYGLLSPANRRLLGKAREILGARTLSLSSSPPEQADGASPPRCPSCGKILVFVQRLKPQPRRPP